MVVLLVLLVFIFIYILKALSNLSISEKSTFLPQPLPHIPHVFLNAFGLEGLIIIIDYIIGTSGYWRVELFTFSATISFHGNLRWLQLV